jgi:hypothetical protein
MSFNMQPIPMLYDYCGDGNPVIVEEFRDRWRRCGWRKRASYAWLRKLRREGVTHIAVDVGGRTADFTIAELTMTGLRACGDQARVERAIAASQA